MVFSSTLTLEVWSCGSAVAPFRLHDIICRLHFHSHLASSLFYGRLLQFIDWMLNFHCIQNSILVGAAHKYCVVATKVIRNYCQATGEHWCWICSWPLHSMAIATSIPFPNSFTSLRAVQALLAFNFNLILQYIYKNLKLFRHLNN